MRNALKLLAPISLLALAACDQDAADDAGASPDAAVEAAAADAAAPVYTAVNDPAEAAPGGTSVVPLPARPEIPVSLPQMAYAFDYGFRLAGTEIAPLQQQHADMCEAQGPYVCRIVSMTRTGEEEDEIAGQLQLAVASDKARGFAGLLSAAAGQHDAEQFRANINGEDVSKSIVDTQAQIRSRIALRDRLMEVLRTRKGSVEDLVEAERQVAAVNQEIDQAQSWLREQQGRVAFSTMTLTYESATPGGSFLKPIEGVIGSLGAIFGTAIAALILIAATVGPILLGVFGIRRLQRRPAVEA